MKNGIAKAVNEVNTAYSEAIDCRGSAADSIMNNATAIVAAYLSHNALPPAEVPVLLRVVHAELQSISRGETQGVIYTNGSLNGIMHPAREPAVPVNKSVHRDYIICLEDGKKFRSMKRHLTQLGMTPETYRAKWSLPSDYPMVAASYAQTRSELAKSFGLGRKPVGRAAA